MFSSDCCSHGCSVSRLQWCHVECLYAKFYVFGFLPSSHLNCCGILSSAFIVVIFSVTLLSSRKRRKFSVFLYRCDVEVLRPLGWPHLNDGRLFVEVELHCEFSLGTGDCGAKQTVQASSYRHPRCFHHLPAMVVDAFFSPYCLTSNNLPSSAACSVACWAACSTACCAFDGWQQMEKLIFEWELVLCTFVCLVTGGHAAHRMLHCEKCLWIMHTNWNNKHLYFLVLWRSEPSSIYILCRIVRQSVFLISVYMLANTVFCCVYLEKVGESNVWSAVERQKTSWRFAADVGFE